MSLRLTSIAPRAACALACAAALALAAAAGAAPVQDTLTLTKGEPVKGRFDGYKNGRIYFVPADGGKPIHALRAEVAELTVEPPAKVTVKPVGKSKLEGVSFSGYKAAAFAFEQGGKPLDLTAAHVSAIELGLDFGRSMADPAGTVRPAADEPVDVEAQVKPGVVTVVHFHMAASVPSVREGNYVSTLARDSHGKIEVVRIDLKDFEDPAAVKYAIRSVPQFWFYGRDGKLSSKLTDRFIDSEIDAALKKAGVAVKP